MKETVLVGVLKNRRDLEILLKENWYRIPVFYAPKKKFEYLAFYEPLKFGKSGKCVRYYGKVIKKEIKKRIELLPKEKNHPRAGKNYLKISFKKIIKLKKPIKNIIPRRIYFGFTDLRKLLNANDILELYDIANTEKIVENLLKKEKIKYKAQYYELINKRKRFRLDFVIFTKKGKIAIECDNDKAHQGKRQQQKDKIKDKILHERGFMVIRLKEKEILDSSKSCLKIIEETVASLN